MLGALLIVFREVIEAGLIVGITLAVTRQVPHGRAFVAMGVAAGLLGAGVVALFIEALSGLFAGAGQELFNAAILSIAAIMLVWHNVWMAHHGKELARHIRNAGQELQDGGGAPTGLAIVVAIAVLREGSEVALFLYGLLSARNEGAMEIFAGGVLGLFAGVALAAATYYGLVIIPQKRLFQVTGVILSLLAAGMAAQAVQFLAQADVLTVLQAEAWDSGWLLSESSVLGRAMHALVGYVERPTVLQLVTYVAVLAAIYILSRVSDREPRQTIAHGNS